MEIRPGQTFREWVAERCPECGDAVLPDGQTVWYAKAPENLAIAEFRLANAVADWLDILRARVEALEADQDD